MNDIATAARADDGSARIAFVGTGPGAPGLLTVRGAELVAEAEVVVLDAGTLLASVERHLGGDVLVVEARTGEEGDLSIAGRAMGLAARAAERANARAAAPTPAGSAPGPATATGGGGDERRPLVVRLMEGASGTADTLRAELAACLEAGLTVEVVPGVSKATAVPTYAGIPWAGGDAAATLIVTSPETLDGWSAGAAADVNVILVGAVERLAAGLDRLLDQGRDPHTQVALVANGSTTDQRTTVATLGESPKQLRAGRLGDPTVAVVGRGVAEREAFSWFESLPLFGWRVLVPRTKEQSFSMLAELERYGAVGEVVPTISIEPPRTPAQMDRAIEGMVTGRYEWVGFTSVNAVRAVREKFAERGLDSRAFSGLKIAAVGGVTAEALLAMGLTPDLVPTGEQSAKGLLDAWPGYDAQLDPINGVFLPRADIATDILVAGLQEMGWEVDDVTAYRTVRAAPPPAPTREAIKKGDFDAVVFTSSSTVRNLVGIAGKPHPTTVVACIGPATAQTAEEHGLVVSVMSPEPNGAVLIEALAAFGTRRAAEALAEGRRPVRPSETNPRRRKK